MTQALKLSNTKPLYTHDSEDGHFLGSMVIVYGDNSSGVEDVYLHVGADEATIVRRMSNEPSEYSAFPESITKMVSEITSLPGVPTYPDHALAYRLRTEFYSNVRPRPNAHAEEPEGDIHTPFCTLRYLTAEPKGADGLSHRLIMVLQMPTYFIGEEAKIEQILSNYFPSTYCQHDYDCCGHTYSRSAKYTHLKNGKVLVSQDRYVNV